MVPQIAKKNITKLSVYFRSCSLVMLCLDAGNSNSTDSTSEDTGFSKAELTHFRYKDLNVTARLWQARTRQPPVPFSSTTAR
jgi:hypothetical protein